LIVCVGTYVFGFSVPLIFSKVINFVAIKPVEGGCVPSSNELIDQAVFHLLLMLIYDVFTYHLTHCDRNRAFHFFYKEKTRVGNPVLQKREKHCKGKIDGLLSNVKKGNIKHTKTRQGRQVLYLGTLQNILYFGAGKICSIFTPTTKRCCPSKIIPLFQFPSIIVPMS